MSLAERIEAATGPDRELDAAIVKFLHPGAIIERYCADDDEPVVFHAAPLVNNKQELPRYTASIDAAMMLLPEGWRPYTLDMSVKGRSRWALEGPKTKWETDDDGMPCAGDDWFAQGIAATPALALTAAAIRAGAK